MESNKIWLLYRPEPFEINSDDDRAIHLWMRRCDPFTTRENVDVHLEKILGYRVAWTRHDLFPELEIGYDSRGFRWFVCPAELDTLV